MQAAFRLLLTAKFLVEQRMQFQNIRGCQFVGQAFQQVGYELCDAFKESADGISQDRFKKVR